MSEQKLICPIRFAFVRKFVLALAISYRKPCWIAFLAAISSPYSDKLFVDGPLFHIYGTLHL